MDRLRERLASARKALAALDEVVRIDKPTSIERDAAIQRFEFTYEAVWKAAKEVLFQREGVDVASPKGVIRACREIGMLSEEQAIAALKMTDDRNLTVHTYNERLAVEIHSRLKDYLELLNQWLEKMQETS